MTLAASKTMGAVCAVRAEEGDPLSARILPLIPDAQKSRRTLDAGSRGLFSRSVMVRSRFFDDLLRRRAATNDQLVVLSAGLDTRFLSSREWRGRPAFSVDHPGSQALCRSVLDRAGIAAKDLHFVPFDLASGAADRLLDGLIEAGLDPLSPTLFVWEGATYYIAEQAVTSVLEAVGKRMARATVSADFLDRSAYFENGEIIAGGVAKNLQFLRDIGEPWVGFFDRDGVAASLSAVGFEVEITDRRDVELRFLREAKMRPGTMFFVEAEKGVTS